MRRGLDDSHESRDNFFAIFDGAFALGAAAITVHGRTVRQRYEGPSSWDFLREVKQHAGHADRLGSGDLFTAEDCLDMLAQTGVDGVTVARGAIGNPWIFRQIRALAAGEPLPPPPTCAEQREVMPSTTAWPKSRMGRAGRSRLMCTSAIKYSRLHPQALQVRDAFAAVRREEQWWKVLQKVVRSVAASPCPARPAEDVTTESRRARRRGGMNHNDTKTRRGKRVGGRWHMAGGEVTAPYSTYHLPPTLSPAGQPPGRLVYSAVLSSPRRPGN